MRIKAVGQERGFPQIAVAKTAKISPSYRVQSEGRAKHPPIRPPRLPRLQRLAKTLKVTVGALVE